MPLTVMRKASCLNRTIPEHEADMSQHPSPDKLSERRFSRAVRVGAVTVGGGAPVSVQTMTKTDTRDVDATVSQIHEAELAGVDIVRLAVPDQAAAEALTEIGGQVSVPLIADIHFDHTLAIRAVEAGVDGLRINPGNIGDRERVADVVSSASERRLPIRIGVNSGSVEEDIRRRCGGATAEALVESALRHVRILEDLDYEEIKISVKASDPLRTVAAYRLLAQRCTYPLHLGVTEAGTFMAGSVRSAVALGILLGEGIGDTIRVSLTDSPAREVHVGLEILRSLGLRAPGPHVISCPTCGRCQVNVGEVAVRVEAALESLYRERPTGPRAVVAVMGCIVNGPGEAREADIAIAGGKGRFALYVDGAHQGTVDEADAVDALVDAVADWLAARCDA
jgi:(E)-4-hydroxy-3-methylbut-2-enyl-diphosphate synthase